MLLSILHFQILFGIGIIELVNWDNTFSGTTPPGDYGFDGGFLKNKSEKDIAAMKLKEIKNGRLAMVGIIGMIWAYLRLLLLKIFFFQPNFLFE